MAPRNDAGLAGCGKTSRAPLALAILGLSAALGGALPACLLNSSAFESAGGPAAGSAGSSVAGSAGAGNDTSSSGTTSPGGSGGSGGSSGSGGSVAGGSSGNAGSGGSSGSAGTGGGDTCPGLQVSVALYTTVIANNDTTTAMDDYESEGCGGGEAPDLVYAVTAEDKGHLVVTLGPEAPYAGFLHSRSDCDKKSKQTACGDGQISVPVEKDEVVFVFVDGHSQVPAGKFTVTFFLSGCGNGTIEAKEHCDDGNLMTGDECGPDCKVSCTNNDLDTANFSTYIDPATHHCYVRVRDRFKHWQDARNDCIAWGGDLAVLATTAEITAVNALLSSDNDGIWIGGSDAAEDGKFKWVNGEEWIYTNGNPPWEFLEPNGGTGENCVEVYDNKRLNDDICDGKDDNYICERAPVGTPAQN